jgi:hypothetical protein
MSTYKFVIKGTLAMMVVTQGILTIYVYFFFLFLKRDPLPIKDLIVYRIDHNLLLFVENINI